MRDLDATRTEADATERTALWNAIRVAATTLRRAWDVRVFLESGAGREIAEVLTVPSAPTWKLVEILSALAILTNAQSVTTRKVWNLASKTGPIEYLKDGSPTYLWTQPIMKGDESGLGGRPDIVITRTSDAPSHTNAVQIIESKCNKALGTPDIRAEFAKGFDLRVRSYFIWSFFSPSERLVLGARKLGIDLTAIGFDTPARAKLLIPENLLLFVSERIEASRTTEHFALLLEATADEVSRKLLT
jgi:hypothetical protein